MRQPEREGVGRVGGRTVRPITSSLTPVPAHAGCQARRFVFGDHLNFRDVRAALARSGEVSRAASRAPGHRPPDAGPHTECCARAGPSLGRHLGRSSGPCRVRTRCAKARVGSIGCPTPAAGQATRCPETPARGGRMPSRAEFGLPDATCRRTARVVCPAQSAAMSRTAAVAQRRTMTRAMSSWPPRATPSRSRRVSASRSGVASVRLLSVSWRRFRPVSMSCPRRSIRPSV